MTSRLSTARQVQFADEQPQNDGDGSNLVQLATVVCEVPNRLDWTQEENRSMYYSQADTQSFRKTAQRYAARLEGRTSLSGHLDHVLCTDKNSRDEAQESLHRWVIGAGRQQEDSVRGLERLANRFHGNQRQDHQMIAIMNVIHAQDCLPGAPPQGREGNDGDGGDDDDKAEQIRKISSKASRTARNFARMMGKADHHALAATIETEESSVASSATSVASLTSTDSSSCSLSSNASLGCENSSVASAESFSATRASQECIPSGENQKQPRHQKLAKNLKRAIFGSVDRSRRPGRE